MFAKSKIKEKKYLIRLFGFFFFNKKFSTKTTRLQRMLGSAYQIPVSFKTWGVQKAVTPQSFNLSQIKKLK